MENGTTSHRPPLPSDRQGFNRRWYAELLSQVYVPESTLDVVDALNDAILRFPEPGAIRVVSGRHCYEDFVYEAGRTMAIIDMSQMTDVSLVTTPPDPTMIDVTHVLSAGASNWHAFKQLFTKFGKVLPGGSCYSVGSGGHISVGGYGLLSRLFGLTSDLVTGFEVVTVDESQRARVRYAHANAEDQDDRDLFWALRGAGAGNFGIITKYFFGASLPDAPYFADITTYAWDWADIQSGADIKSIGDVIKNIFNGVNGLDFPETEFGIFRLFHRAKGQLNMTIQNVYPSLSTYQIDRAQYLLRTEKRLAAFEGAGVPVKWAAAGPVDPDQFFDPKFMETGQVTKGRSAAQASLDITRNYTIYEAVQTLNGSGSNKRGDYKSAYMQAEGFTENQYDTLFAYLTEIGPTDFSDSRLNVDSYGGKVNLLSAADTPIPQRSSIFKLQYQTYWQSSASVGSPDEPGQANVDWLRRFYGDMYSESGGVPSVPGSSFSPNNTDGCYYGYPDIDLGSDDAARSRSEAMELYFGKANYQRLKSIKSRVDPLDMFQSKQSIELPR